MFALFMDCETNGFCRANNKSGQPDKRSARVIQLAWELVDIDDGEIIIKENFLIKPDNWIIPIKPFWVEHGYSTKKSIKEGFEMKEVLPLFIESYNAADILVAHNLVFDNKAIGDEMLRYRITPVKNPNMIKICTMKASVDYCAIPNKDGRSGNKNPKLTELYQLLFNKQFEGAHDSGSDVAACRKCFFELVNRKIITL